MKASTEQDRAQIEKALAFACWLIQIPPEKNVEATFIFVYQYFQFKWGAVYGPSWGWN